MEGSWKVLVPWSEMGNVIFPIAMLPSDLHVSFLIHSLVAQASIKDQEGVIWIRIVIVPCSMDYWVLFSAEWMPNKTDLSYRGLDCHNSCTTVAPRGVSLFRQSLCLWTFMRALLQPVISSSLLGYVLISSWYMEWKRQGQNCSQLFKQVNRQHSAARYQL